MKKNNKTLLWVCPEFKVRIKQEAAKNNKSIIDFTKDVANFDDPLKDLFTKKNKKNNNKNEPFPFSF